VIRNLNLGRKQVKENEEGYGIEGLERASEGPSLNVLDEELETQSTKKKVRRQSMVKG